MGFFFFYFGACFCGLLAADKIGKAYVDYKKSKIRRFQLAFLAALSGVCSCVCFLICIQFYVPDAHWSSRDDLEGLCVASLVGGAIVTLVSFYFVMKWRNFAREAFNAFKKDVVESFAAIFRADEYAPEPRKVTVKKQQQPAAKDGANKKRRGVRSAHTPTSATKPPSEK